MRVFMKKLRVEIENEMRVFLETLDFEIEMRVSQKSGRHTATVKTRFPSLNWATDQQRQSGVTKQPLKSTHYCMLQLGWANTTSTRSGNRNFSEAAREERRQNLEVTKLNAAPKRKERKALIANIAEEDQPQATVKMVNFDEQNKDDLAVAIDNACDVKLPFN